MGSKIISNLDQGFRFAPPLALCYCPFQGLQKISRIWARTKSGAAELTTCDQPVASPIPFPHMRLKTAIIPGISVGSRPLKLWRNVLVPRKMNKEWRNLLFSYLSGMTDVIVKNELPDPVDVTLLGSVTVMTKPDERTDHFEKLWHDAPSCNARRKNARGGMESNRGRAS
jgi:hypothetical protein